MRKVNVSGKVYQIEEETLKKSELFSNFMKDFDNDVDIPIYRSHVAFEHILEYMRNPYYHFPKEYEEEFKYYLIDHEDIRCDRCNYPFQFGRCIGRCENYPLHPLECPCGCHKIKGYIKMYYPFISPLQNPDFNMKCSKYFRDRRRSPSIEDIENYYHSSTGYDIRMMGYPAYSSLDKYLIENCPDKINCYKYLLVDAIT